MAGHSVVSESPEYKTGNTLYQCNVIVELDGLQQQQQQHQNKIH